MRRIVLSLVLVTACSSSSDDPSPLFGGFTVQDTTAVVFAPAVCNIPSLGTTSVSGAAIVFTDHERACEVVKATSLCGARQSSTEVVALAIRGIPGSGGVGPVATGTYPFLANPPTGPFSAMDAYAHRLDSTCRPLSGGDPDLVGGSVSLSIVETGRLAGSVDLRFAGNQAFQDTFDVTVCTTGIDLCQRLEDCGSILDPVCAPTTT